MSLWVSRKAGRETELKKFRISTEAILRVGSELVDERMSEFIPGEKAVRVQQSTVKEVEDM